MHCTILPLASFIPPILSTSPANLRVVPAVTLLPVLPGTLYTIIAFGDALAIVL